MNLFFLDSIGSISKVCKQNNHLGEHCFLRAMVVFESIQASREVASVSLV
jgi:hypothetical protein